MSTLYFKFCCNNVDMYVYVFSQVSQVYESITLSRLVELSLLTNTTELEKVVVETASSNNIQVGSRSTRVACSDDHHWSSFANTLNFRYVENTT